ncbi:MAG: DUF2975 domain-containing protein [Clostridia bacterium]|nr:DUF2975 domain-containing protein [Clostridia bacterium]
MAEWNRADGEEKRYSRIGALCKVFWVLFRVLAYVAGILVGLLAVMAVVLIFVRVTPEELLFLPSMKVTEIEGVRHFGVSLGNGVEVFKACAEVGVSSIKGTVYAGLFTLMAGLAVSVPVFHFLSCLMKNVSSGKVLSADNAGFVNYIGLAIMVGNPIVLLIQRFYNYKLISYFVEEKLEFDFGIDLFGFLLGLLIIVIGTVYGYACTLHKEELALVVSESRD